MYYIGEDSVNDEYLSNCFYWARKYGLDIPVYQIDRKKNIKNIKDEKYILMLTGNEDHESLDYLYENEKIVAIIKNYPHMINQGSEDSRVYTFDFKRQRLVCEKEDSRTLNIPLGHTNGYQIYAFEKRKIKGGFLGQATLLRRQLIDKIHDIYPDFKFGLYEGFGPFVQGRNGGSLNIKDYAYNLSNMLVSLCLNGQSPETFRLFESAMAGCIMLSTPLPDTWYYEDSPIITLHHWDDTETLKSKFEHALCNSEIFVESSRNWYNEKVSPQSVGKKIMEHIEKL